MCTSIREQIKPGSLFNDGLCPLIYSAKENEAAGKEWVRGGYDISYFKNSYQRDTFRTQPRFHYTLTFSYKFLHDADTVYFAHSYPYTYSNLIQFLNTLTMNPEINK